LRLASLLRVRGARRAVAAQFVIDESAAMGLARGRAGFWATGLAVFVCWNVATAAGAIGGTALSDPRALGLDAAAPAAFLALLAPRLAAPRTAAIALAAAVAAIVAVPLTPTGVPVLVAAAVAVAAR
jgi:predicted branched-subunit amino acid permease